ncbi:MAG: hypothetical protein PHO65_04805 [Sulfurovum sp.]|nr:hypothetical protein [Sulfurovum sp.]
MIRLLFSFILFFSLSEAKPQKNYAFAGLLVSTQTINIDDEATTHKSGAGIRYGQQSLEWRTMFSLEYYPNNYASYSIEIDKILLDEMFGTPKIRPYLGGTIGYLKYDKNALEGIPHDETVGIYYGGNIGFILYAADNIDIDLGYRYYKVGNLDFLDHLHGPTLAIHYFF